jgi:hypothetical protein
VEETKFLIFNSEGVLGVNMLNKNIIIQFLYMGIGQTRFSLLVTFYLDYISESSASLNDWSLHQSTTINN